MRRMLVWPAFGLLVIGVLFAHGAAAQSTTGTITGRVLWGPCIRAIPLPVAPDVQAQPAPAQQPPTTQGLPAGAVLVAVQGTGISARTDETGKFTLSGVPTGQYLTVAAGPVANASSAIAERPNVFLDDAQSPQTLDIGTLSLGGSPSTGVGIACRVMPLTGAPAPADTGPATPPPDTPDTNP